MFASRLGNWVLRSLFRLLTFPFALLYGIVVEVRNLAYTLQLLPSKGFPIVVISVGNISVGGTGKTPLAKVYLNRVSEFGFRPAYLSRGYGRSTRGYLEVDLIQHNSDAVGDEALEVKEDFPDMPVVVCEDRVEGVRRLMREHPIDVVVLDDGFQHRRLRRDLDIISIDALHSPWKDLLLPMGRLREPAWNLRRANLLVIRNSSKLEKFKPPKRYYKRLVYARLEPRDLIPLDSQLEAIPGSSLFRQPVVAFSGLGDNESFRDMLFGQSFNLLGFFLFEDHHPYSSEDLQHVTAFYQNQVNLGIFTETPIILTTQKDAMRLKDREWFNEEFADLPIFYLRVELRISGNKRSFDSVLKRKLERKLSSTHAEPEPRTV